MIDKEFKFKIGDKVRVVQLDKRDSVDIAFNIGETLTINRLVKGYYGNTYFFVNREYGLYEKQLEALPKTIVFNKSTKEDKCEKEKLTPKFKIGNKVRYIKEDSFTNKRFKLGEVYTISESWFNPMYNCMTYWFKEEGIFGLSEKQLELVKEDKKEVVTPKKDKKSVLRVGDKVNKKPERNIENIKITYKGTTTIADIHGDIGKSRFNGTNSIDKFDTKKGVLIATARALGYKEAIINELVELLFNEKLEDNKPKAQPKENIEFRTKTDKDTYEWIVFEF